MAAKIPAFPTAASLAALKKVKVDAAGIDVAAVWTEKLGGATTVKKSVDVMSALVSKISGVYSDLAKAISKKSDVVTKYKALDTAFKQLDLYNERAQEFKRQTRAKAAEVKKNHGEKGAKKLIAWYKTVGEEVAAHAAKLRAACESLLSAAEKVDLSKITDLEWELNHWDVTHTLLKVHRFKFDHLGSKGQYRVMVTVTGKGGADASKNATLRQEFFDAAYEVGKREAKTLGAELKTIDGDLTSGKTTPDGAAKPIAAAYDRFETKYETGAAKAVQEVWNTYCKDKADYRKYKLKCRVKIAGKVIGTGVGITTTVAAGWTGVGTIMGAGAAIKNGAEVLYAIKDMWQSAQNLRKEIDRELVALQKRFKEPNTASAIESGGQALEALTGYRTSTVTTVGKKVRDFGFKLKGVHENAVKLGKQIDTAHREIKGLKSKLRKSQAAAKSSPKVKTALAKTEKKIDRFGEMVGSLVEKAATSAGDYREGKTLLADYTTILGKLEGDIHGAAKAINKWGVPLLKFAFVSDTSGAILTAGSVTREYTAAAAELTDELQALNEGIDLTGDVATMIKTLVGKS
ncbi:MAG: hypothetical protein AAGJ46_06080 [Planctomycetota bacterium]